MLLLLLLCAQLAHWLEANARHGMAEVGGTYQHSCHGSPTCRLMMAREPPDLVVRRGRLAAGMICRLVPRQMDTSCM